MAIAVEYWNWLSSKLHPGLDFNGTRHSQILLPDGLWRRRLCALLVVRPGRMIYEMGGVAENIAGKAISVAASKIPRRTQFIILQDSFFVFVLNKLFLFLFFSIEITYSKKNTIQFLNPFECSR